MTVTTKNPTKRVKTPAKSEKVAAPDDTEPTGGTTHVATIPSDMTTRAATFAMFVRAACPAGQNVPGDWEIDQKSLDGFTRDTDGYHITYFTTVLHLLTARDVLVDFFRMHAREVDLPEWPVVQMEVRGIARDLNDVLAPGARNGRNLRGTPISSSGASISSSGTPDVRWVAWMQRAARRLWARTVEPGL